MGVVVRQSIVSTIISYIGVIIGYINLLYLYPKFLSPDQVGLLRTIQDAAILFSPFAQLGLTQSIFRYHPQLVKDKSTSHAFITFMLLFALGGFTLFFLVFKFFEGTLLSFFNDNAKEIINYTSLVIWLTLILVLMGAFEALSRSLLKTIFPNLLREVAIRLLLSVLVLLYFLKFLTFDQFMIGSILVYLLCLVTLIIYLWAIGELGFSGNFGVLDKSKLPPLFQYSILSFAGMAGMILIGKMDSLMVSSMIGLAANAIYTTAFYMATVIEIPKRALSQIAMPLIARAFEKNDLKDIEAIYQKTALNQLIIGSLILIGLYANLDAIFMLMPKKEIYEAGKIVVLMVGLGKLIDMAFGPSSEIIVLSKHYWFNMILIVILALCLLVANNFLIPLYGINGAAAGAALALFVFNLVKYIYLKVTTHIQPFQIGSLKVIAISALTLLINYLLPHVNNLFADILYRSVIITLFFSGMILFTKASVEANYLLTKALTVFKGKESNRPN